MRVRWDPAFSSEAFLWLFRVGHNVRLEDRAGAEFAEVPLDARNSARFYDLPRGTYTVCPGDMLGRHYRTTGGGSVTIADGAALPVRHTLTLMPQDPAGTRAALAEAKALLPENLVTREGMLLDASSDKPVVGAEVVLTGLATLVRLGDAGSLAKVRDALGQEKTIAVLERSGEDRHDQVASGSVSAWEAYVDLRKAFESVASGGSDKAVAYLLPLLDSKLYAPESGKHTDVRRRMVYSSLRQVPAPGKDLLEFLARKMEFRADSGLCQDAICEVLASWGTKESVDLFHRHSGGYYGRYYFIYRDRYELSCRFLEGLRSVAAKGQGTEVDRAWVRDRLALFLGDSIPGVGGRGVAPIALPKFGARGKEDAEKFVRLFRGYLANPGKVELTAEEKAKFDALISSLERPPVAPVQKKPPEPPKPPTPVNTGEDAEGAE